MKFWLRRKPFIAYDEHSDLKKALTAFELVFMGIGAIIGAGVFVLTGIAAATRAGPGVVFSYMLAGLSALFSALSYAELSASIGGKGSAYSYSYAAFGELIAWMIGWDLILEYTMSVITVAIGWSGYVQNLLQALSIPLSASLIKGPFEGGIINLLGFGIIVVLSLLLCSGVKESSKFNVGIVFIKLSAILLFIIVSCQKINFNYWNPFLPFGWSGVVQGGALVFFAYVGFDALSTAAEETIHPQKDLPIGILYSLFICTLIYVITSAFLTLIIPYYKLNVRSPVSYALLQIGYPMAASWIAVGAIAGLTTVMLIMYYGLTRIVLAIAKDGLLPPFLTPIHPRRKTPITIILLTGAIMAIAAGLFPLEDVAELVNIGTLAAFILVCSGTIILRQLYPDIQRPFKLPFHALIPGLGIFFSLILMLYLPKYTWIRFIVWALIGFLIYFLYSCKHSRLNENS